MATPPLTIPSSAIPTTTTTAPSQAQFGRACTLVVYQNNGQPKNGIDLSQFRIKFMVKRSDTQTPNTADIRVYNLSDETASFLQTNFGNLNRLTGVGGGSVLLQAGYASNFGVVFRGNIKQIIIGRESATDTFIDIIAGDGDRAYNFAIVNQTIAPGASSSDQVLVATASMAKNGVTAGNALGPIATMNVKLPRGKVMYGNAKDYLRSAAKNTQQAWSIQEEALSFVPLSSYLPGQVVKINSQTGMIGSPQQTTEGVNVKCLLNPLIKIGTRIQLNERDVQMLKINLSVPGTAANIPARLTADGVYYVLCTEQTGDTRGTEWYTNIIGLAIAISSNPLNSVVAVNG